MTNRKQRLQEMLAVLKKAQERGKSVDKEKFVAQTCFNWGTARRTILEYIVILQGCGYIAVEGNCIEVTI